MLVKLNFFRVAKLFLYPLDIMYIPNQNCFMEKVQILTPWRKNFHPD